jgi:hypothetical protein
MSYVENCIRTLDSRVWHGVEKMASEYPNASRLLAIPVAIGTLIRDTIAVPARGVEEFYFFLKSITADVPGQSPQMRLKHSNDADCYAICAFTCAVATPFSPLIGIIDAIVSFVKVALFPLKTAKINAAQRDFEFFLTEMNYSDTCGENFANQVEFAKEEFSRFNKRIASAASHEEIKNLHFLDEENSKQIIIQDIGFKEVKWRTFQMIYSLEKRRIGELVPGNEVSENQHKALRENWINIQMRLISADPIPEDQRLNHPPYIYQNQPQNFDEILNEL